MPNCLSLELIKKNLELVDIDSIVEPERYALRAHHFTIQMYGSIIMFKDDKKNEVVCDVNGGELSIGYSEGKKVIKLVSKNKNEYYMRLEE